MSYAYDAGRRDSNHQAGNQYFLIPVRLEITPAKDIAPAVTKRYEATSSMESNAEEYSACDIVSRIGDPSPTTGKGHSGRKGNRQQAGGLLSIYAAQAFSCPRLAIAASCARTSSGSACLMTRPSLASRLTAEVIASWERDTTGAIIEIRCGP